MTSPAQSDEIALATAAVPARRWAVGVSGGVDSVALLCLLSGRPDLSLHVVHLDHETRNGASAEDAAFVRDLAERLKLPHTIARRSEVEPTLADLPANASARYRAARLALFRRVVAEHDLAGVLLAHHADDQAETIFQRLLRGSGPAGLGGMAVSTHVGGLHLLRPMLGVRRDVLRDVLRERNQPWREDGSNASGDYLRNRLRSVLSARPGLIEALMQLSATCRRLRNWQHASAPDVEATLAVSRLLELPDPLRRELVRKWLASVGVPEGRIEPDVIARLIEMAQDVATPARRVFPGNVAVRRSRGMLSALPKQDADSG